MVKTSLLIRLPHDDGPPESTTRAERFAPVRNLSAAELEMRRRYFRERKQQSRMRLKASGDSRYSDTLARYLRRLIAAHPRIFALVYDPTDTILFVPYLKRQFAMYPLTVGGLRYLDLVPSTPVIYYFITRRMSVGDDAVMFLTNDEEPHIELMRHALRVNIETLFNANDIREYGPSSDGDGWKLIRKIPAFIDAAPFCSPQDAPRLRCNVFTYAQAGFPGHHRIIPWTAPGAPAWALQMREQERQKMEKDPQSASNGDKPDSSS